MDLQVLSTHCYQLFVSFLAEPPKNSSLAETDRFVWQLAVQVGSQSISPLFWALRSSTVGGSRGGRHECGEAGLVQGPSLQKHTKTH